MAKMPVTKLILITHLIVFGECQMNPFVAEGGDADIDDFPYVAYLGINCTEIDDFDIYCCGSSIINQYLTLTAAHCVFYCLERSTISVSVGHVNIKKAAISSANSFFIHEDYCQQTAVNDIALVMVKTPIKFNERVSRVVLMPKPPYDQEAYIAGWGYIDEKREKGTEILKYTAQRVWKRKECLKMMKSMPKGTFCAGSNTLRGYPSVGDSGSALVVRDYIQIGIVSFKEPSISKSMAIYTDTGHFYKWIKKHATTIFCANQ